MALTGKVAVVTGGNSGIGQAIVLALAAQGATVVIDWVVGEQATEALEDQVRALGDKVLGVQADVSKVADLERLIAATVTAFGRVDVMVNNAGVETRTSVPPRRSTTTCSTSTSRARSSARSSPRAR